MAQDVSCPNCHQGFGKDKENPYHKTCDVCGTEFYNENGYEVDIEGNEIEDDAEYEEQAHKAYYNKHL